MHYIYGLVDPVSMEIKYVGQTGNIKARFNDHWSSERNNFFKLKTKSFNNKNEWIRHIRHNIGEKPIVIILQKLNADDDINAAETWWIENLVKQGCKLLNQGGIDKHINGVKLNKIVIPMSEIRTRLTRIGLNFSDGAKLLGFSNVIDLYSTKAVSHGVKLKMTNLEFLSRTGKLENEVKKLYK